MNWDEIAGAGRRLWGKAKEKLGKLTDNELMTIAGKREQSAGKIQQIYGTAGARAKKRFGAPVLIPVTSPTPPRDVPGNRR
jgi:uncharacterized protein YjbJ (UPF0337 family)